MSNKLEEKLNKIMDEVIDIKVTMARNTEALEQHMRRTEIAEESIELTREQVNKLKTQLVNEFKPIKSHIAFVKGAMWSVGIFASLLFGLHQMGILQKLF